MDGPVMQLNIAKSAIRVLGAQQQLEALERSVCVY